MPGVPTPSSILRGHASALHSLSFHPSNLILASGDATGYVVLWTLPTRRARAAWRAHDGAVLQVAFWGDAVISMARGSLKVWKARDWSLGLGLGEVVKLPVFTSTQDNEDEEGKIPDLEHEIVVQGLSFCGFGHIAQPDNALLLALPGEDSSIILYRLPHSNTEPVGVIPVPAEKAGMLMTLRAFIVDGGQVHIAAGYEGGLVAVFARVADQWAVRYVSRAHSEPVLGIDVAPPPSSSSLESKTGGGYFWSSAADGLIVKHPLLGNEPLEILSTKHKGQQSLCVRSDGLILATAGWDGRGRVYAAKGKLREVAVMKWHKEGCFAVAFARVDTSGEGGKEVVTREGSLTVAEQRVRRTAEAHCIALGSKDGKISLWELF